MTSNSSGPRRVANKTIISEDLFTGQPVLQELADLYPLSKAEYMIIRDPPANAMVWSLVGAGLSALTIAAGQWAMKWYARETIPWSSNESIGGAGVLLLAILVFIYSRFRRSEYRSTMSELRDHFNPKKKKLRWYTEAWGWWQEWRKKDAA